MVKTEKPQKKTTIDLLPFILPEEKEMTYAQNQRLQKKFIRTLVNKIHTITAMNDEIRT